MDRTPNIFQLESPNVAERLQAAEYASRNPDQCCEWAVALTKAAGDSSDAIAMAAAEALEMLGAPPASMLMQLIGLAKTCVNVSLPKKNGTNANSETAYWAVTLIGRLGPKAAPATDCLIEILNQSDYLPVRERATWAISRIGTAASSASSALRHAAAEGPPRLKRLATQALESIRGMAA